MIPSPHHRLDYRMHPPIRYLDLRHREVRYPVLPTVKSAPGRVVVTQYPGGVDFREAADNSESRWIGRWIELTRLHVSRQSRASRASSSQDKSSTLIPFSLASSPMSIKHQPSRYHASTSWSSVMMTSVSTQRASLYIASSRNRRVRDRRIGTAGT